MTDFNGPKSQDPRTHIRLAKVVEFLVTGGFIGLSPWAPGTFGTLWGIPIALGLASGGPVFAMVGTLVLILVAIGLAEFSERFTGSHDRGAIVIDEIVGYLVAVTWLPAGWLSMLLAFVAFRFFDIVKPFPISWLDRRVKGGRGVVIDDVAAGLAANVLLQILLSQWNWSLLV